MHHVFLFFLCVFTAPINAMELPEQKDTSEDRFILDDYRLTSEQLRDGARPSDIITIKYTPRGNQTIADINNILQSNLAITTIDIENAPNTTPLTRLQMNNINHVHLSNCSHIHMRHLASLQNNHNRTPTFTINCETIRPYFWHEARQQYHVPAQINDEISEGQHHTIQYWPNNHLYVRPSPTQIIIDAPFLASIIEPLPNATSIYLALRIITKEGLSYALSLPINYTLNISHLIQNDEMISPVNTADDNNHKYMEIARIKRIDWDNLFYNTIAITNCKNPLLLTTILESLKAMPSIATIELLQCTLDEANLTTIVQLTKKVRLNLCSLPFLSRPSTANRYSNEYLDILTDNSWYSSHTKIMDGVQFSQLAQKIGLTKLQLSNCSLDSSTFAWIAASPIKNIYHSNPSISQNNFNPSADYPGIKKEGNDLHVNGLRFSDSAIIGHLQNELNDGQTLELADCYFNEFNLSDLQTCKKCTLTRCSAKQFTSKETADVVEPIVNQYHNDEDQFSYTPWTESDERESNDIKLNDLYLLTTKLLRMLPPIPKLWVTCERLMVHSLNPYDIANSNAQDIIFWSLHAGEIKTSIDNNTLSSAQKFQKKIIDVDHNSLDIKPHLKPILEPTTKDKLHERWRQTKEDLNDSTKRKSYITNSAYAAAHAFCLGTSAYATYKMCQQELPFYKNPAVIPLLTLGNYSSYKLTQHAFAGWKWFWNFPHANRVQ
ncbi:MAG: hypothetical protein WCE21_05440 [Candidatus Babeliales bacterium]